MHEWCRLRLSEREMCIGCGNVRCFCVLDSMDIFEVLLRGQSRCSCSVLGAAEH